MAHATALEPAISVAVTHMKTSLGIEKLTQVGRKWRDAYRREQQAFLQERDMVLGLCWDSPLQEPTPFYDRIIVPLCTPKDLIQEAARMNHCVDTYAGSCMRGDSQIWSLRTDGGATMSTLETRIVRDKRGGFLVKIIEHRSASNARPDYACIAAAEALLRHLRQSGAALENYWRWKMTTARLPSDKRAMVALTKPIIAALKSTLPKRISLDNLAGMGRDYALRWRLRLALERPCTANRMQVLSAKHHSRVPSGVEQGRNHRGGGIAYSILSVECRNILHFRPAC